MSAAGGSGGTFVCMDVPRLERELGEAVRARREREELTRAELAARANVSVGALRNLEVGAGSTVATLVSVVAALGAPEWLTALRPAAQFDPFAVLAEETNAARHRRVRKKSVV